MDNRRRKGSDSISPRPRPLRPLLLDPSRCGVWSPRPRSRPCRVSHSPSTFQNKISDERVAAVADGIPSPRCTPLNYCCCNPSVARAGLPIPVLIHAGVVVCLPRPTGGRASAGRIVTIVDVIFSSCRAPIDICCCSPPGAYAVPLVAVRIHVGVVARRPHPNDGVTAAGSMASVVSGRKPSCCSPISSCSCSPPVAGTAPPVPVLIHAGVVVHLPRPTGGRTPARHIVAIADVLSSPCRAPIDSCCNSPGVYAVSPVPVRIHAGVVVRRPRLIDRGAAAGCVELLSAAVDPHAAHQSVPDAIGLRSKGLVLSFPYLSIPKYLFSSHAPPTMKLLPFASQLSRARYALPAVGCS